MILEFAMALAIQTQTTTCSTSFGITTCNTQAPFPAPPPIQSDPNAFNRGLMSGANMFPLRSPAPREPGRCAGGDWFLIGCTRTMHNDAVAEREARLTSQAARTRAMGLLRDGDCRGALAAALDTGDLDFATQVRAFCSTPQ